LIKGLRLHLAVHAAHQHFNFLFCLAQRFFTFARQLDAGLELFQRFFEGQPAFFEGFHDGFEFFQVLLEPASDFFSVVIVCNSTCWVYVFNFRRYRAFAKPQTEFILDL
jgi:hypothetical protein